MSLRLDACARVMWRRLRVALCVASAIAVGLTPTGSVQARSRVKMEDGFNVGAKRITMGVGKSTIVELPQDAAEIFVGNPTVANAIVRTARKLYIIGAASGQTSIFALDRDGKEIASFEISVGRDIGELTQILQAALPGSHIQVRTINDTIILTGIVDSAEDALRAADLAKGFANKLLAAGSANSEGSDSLVVNSLTIRGRDQVMLKVTVSEMRRDIAKQLGITSSNWGALQQYNPFGINGVIASDANRLGTNGLPLASSLNINSASGLTATLSAFERYGVTRTLAEPTVTAVSGESAKFTVGGEFPYSTGYVCSGGTTGVSVGSSASSLQCTNGAAFKPYGITLNFEPIVLSEGRILLHLATEISDLDFQHAVIIGGAPTPGLLTRKNETTIELPSGGSIASAGLIQQKSQQVINGLPALYNIPILGTLFRSRDYQRNETELIIIVTPIIVRPVATSALAKPDDGFADSSDPQAYLLGRMNRLTATPGNPEARRNYRGRIGFIQD